MKLLSHDECHKPRESRKFDVEKKEYTFAQIQKKKRKKEKSKTT
jgi:hypothetical protein